MLPKLLVSNKPLLLLPLSIVYHTAIVIVLMLNLIHIAIKAPKSESILFQSDCVPACAFSDRCDCSNYFS